jgi:voltage-gated potassium channel
MDSQQQTTGTGPTSGPIFLVLRRMRLPLIVLIVIFAVSVLGLTLVPGADPAGRPVRMGFFEAFYFMSYTATTIGFGELPHPFTDAQRLWVTFSIYLTVIGWAYAVGSLLSLVQDNAFRNAIARQRFERKVARLRQPFLIIAGYGNAGEGLGRSWDGLGRVFVAIDVDVRRIDSLDLLPYNADVPGLVADAADPDTLRRAGLQHRYCEAVVAMTDDDEANLAITMSAALLHPGLPVIARTTSPAIEDRMAAFGDPVVINPFDRFGDHLLLALRSPASYQLFTWIEAGPGAPLPPRGESIRPGRWIVSGRGPLSEELIADLEGNGVQVSLVDPDPALPVDVEHAVGLVAGTDNDTTNLSLVAAARRRNRDLFTAARQNQPANEKLFAAMDLDLVLVPSRAVAQEAYARLSTPLIWRFLEETARRDEAFAVRMLDLLQQRCGARMENLWKIRLVPDEAPALRAWLARGAVTVAHLLRDPDERDDALPLVPLMLLRDGEAVPAPPDDLVLAEGDELLLAGGSAAQRELQATLFSDAAAQYVLTGERPPESWVWRALRRPSRTGA